MAVETLATDATFTGTGVSSTYSPEFYVNSSDQVKVYVDGVLQTIGDDYVVNNVGTAAGCDIVGTFTLGSVVYIERVTPITQLVDTLNNETILEDVLDAEFDKLTMIAQEIDGKASRAVLLPKGESGYTLPAPAARAGKFLSFDPVTGTPIVALGTSVADLATALFLQSGAGAVARAAQAKMRDIISPLDFGCAGDGVTNDTANMLKAITEATSRGARLDGGGKTYLVSALAATITRLSIDNMTLKEANPNTGDPITVKFTASVAGQGYLHLGVGFKVDRTGNGTVGTLNVSCGIMVQNVAIVEAYCEVTGNARGSGLLVDSARYFFDSSYVHDMLCDHTAITDDIQHGSWARYCDTVITSGLVHTLGRIDRSTIARDRYNRGRAYSGCKSVSLGGVVGPGIDQAYDVTGDANGGNTSVKLCGAHANYPYSVAFKFANAVLAISGACATAVEPGLCGVLLGSPNPATLNMTSGGIISGIVQIGGGANGAWADSCVVKLDRNAAAVPGRDYPKGVTITGNVLAYFGGNATTFTVLDSDELTPTISAALNVHKGARVRLTTTGSLPTGLATATDYYITVTVNNTIKLSTSFLNCMDGVYISTFAGGTGTHTMTAQNDVDWGVYSNVDAYDAALPNLVFGNRFGGVVHRSPLVVDMLASATASSAQSTASGVSTFAKGTAETDPYGICALTGGSDSSVLFTTPFDGEWEFNLVGLWTGGAGTGTAQTVLQIDTGGGFVDTISAKSVVRYSVGDFTQEVRWKGYVPKGTKFQTKIFQSDGTRNYQLADTTLRYVR